MGKEKDDREQLIKDVTNSQLTEQFIKDLGYKARVERSDVGDEYTEHMEQLRSVIRDVGENLLEIGAVPKGMQYRGSLTVHVYTSEILRTAAFLNLFVWDKLDYNLADAAMREMNGKIKTSHGKSRQKLRSGF